MSVEWTANNDDLIDPRNTQTGYSTTKKKTSLFAKLPFVGRTKTNIVEKNMRFLNFQNFKILNLSGNFIDFKEIFEMVFPKKSIPCKCTKQPLRLNKKFLNFFKNTCAKCAFIPNRKLVLTLFTKTALNKHTHQDERKIKALTDCSLFVGGFTGKHRSAFFLVGNQGETTIYQRREIRKVFKRRVTEDKFGFEEIQEIEEEGEGIEHNNIGEHLGNLMESEVGFEELFPEQNILMADNQPELRMWEGNQGQNNKKINNIFSDQFRAKHIKEIDFEEREQKECMERILIGGDSWIGMKGEGKRKLSENESFFVDSVLNEEMLKRGYDQKHEQIKFYYLDPHYIQVHFVNIKNRIIQAYN